MPVQLTVLHGWQRHRLIRSINKPQQCVRVPQLAFKADHQMVRTSGGLVLESHRVLVATDRQQLAHTNRVKTENERLRAAVAVEAISIQSEQTTKQ